MLVASTLIVARMANNFIRDVNMDSVIALGVVALRVVQMFVSDRERKGKIDSAVGKIKLHASAVDLHDLGDKE